MRQFSIYILLYAFLLISCGSGKEVQKNSETEIYPSVESKKVNFPTLNIEPNQLIRSPQQVVLNSQGIWSAFEGEVGTVHLMDDNGITLCTGILFADGEWMLEGPAIFSTKLKFDSGLANKGKLVIYSNSGGGDGDESIEQMSFEIPVRFN